MFRTLSRASCVFSRTDHMQLWYGSFENKFSNGTEHTFSIRYICSRI